MQLPPLPLSSHAKPVDVFQAAVQLEKELTQVIKGEVRFDRGSRALYATDGSNYRQIPIGLVVPRDDADVIAAVAACRKYGAPVFARGGGPNFGRQSCKVAGGFDFSKDIKPVIWVKNGEGFAPV